MWLRGRPNYYLSSAFDLPADILAERLATVSAQSTRLPIIMYHYIGLEKNGLSTSPYFLESQIIALKKDGYKFIFVKDVPQALKIFAKKSVALTFDDGYADFYYNALPILKKHQAKATLYVMPNYLGAKNYLSAAQLQEIARSGLVEIGAHTLNHAYLINSRDPAKEIRDSKKKLEEILKEPVETFAYPYGAFGKETVEMVKKAGYTAAVSVIPGTDQSEENLFYLSRLRPGNLTNYLQ